MSYKPRKATKSWLVGAPPYVFDCFDHKKGLERYTILLGGPDYWNERMGRNLQYLGTCSTGIAYSMFGECSASFRPSHHRVRWLDLPEKLRAHTISRCMSCKTYSLLTLSLAEQMTKHHLTLWSVY